MAFTEPNHTYRVKEVLRVVDGDTIDVLIDLGMYLNTRKRIRFLELDTDEPRGGTTETKARANAATQRMIDLLNMGDVFIATKMDSTGKYGRLLGWLYVRRADGSIVDINKTMVAEGYEKGGTGMNFSENIILG